MTMKDIKKQAQEDFDKFPPDYWNEKRLSAFIDKWLDKAYSAGYGVGYEDGVNRLP